MSTLPPAVASLREAAGRLAAAVEANPVPDRAHDQADQLVAELRDLMTWARLIRARQVLRMHDDGLSQAAIGRALGVTRGRVHFVIRQARADLARAAGEAEQQEAA